MNIEEDIETEYRTKRATVPSMEEILYEPFKILDKGFIRVVDYMGDDSAVVQAARVSYGKGTKKVSQDKGLISYLMRHKHTTPFEMCDIKLHIKLPIFVARQWIRHRTASVNEYSARYSILGNEFYLPDKGQIAPQSTVNKQGRAEGNMPDDLAETILDILDRDAKSCYANYVQMMNEDEYGNVIEEGRVGLSRELARMNLNLNFYTEWYWKTNLHNLLHFLKLRADPHAQYEIRVYAEKILEIVKLWVPFVYEAFEEHILLGKNISRKGLAAVKKMIRGEEVSQESSGMGKREWEELSALLKS